MNKPKIPVHCFGDDDPKLKTHKNTGLKLVLINFLVVALAVLVLLLAVTVYHTS